MKALGKEDTPALRQLYDNAVQNPRMWKQFQDDLAKVAGDVDPSKVKKAWGTVQESAGLGKPAFQRGALPVDGPGLRTATEAGIDAEKAAQIQRLADKEGVTIYVVGSRAKGPGATNPLSDWDYVVYGSTGDSRSALRQGLPKGEKYKGNMEGYDFMVGDLPQLEGKFNPLDPNRPYVKFSPKAK